MLKKGTGAGAILCILALSTSVAQAHSLYEAEETLYGLGYYDVRIERASLPYSFNACKRGLRYHIHVDWYGDLVQVDELGPCGGYAYQPRYDDDEGPRYHTNLHRNYDY